MTDTQVKNIVAVVVAGLGLYLAWQRFNVALRAL